MTTKKKLQAPWLQSPVWKDFPVRKGLGHHRIPVGIILAAKKTISCVLESNSIDQVQMRLLNDDSKAEGHFLITNSLQGRSAVYNNQESASVPFIDCEYLKEPPTESRTVTISYPSDSKVLPIYHWGENETKFFQLWDSEDAEFAYIESDYFGLLIPKIDKEASRNLPDGKHLDDLIVFYDKVFVIYSYLIGLSFKETGTNQNVKNRFFIKADKHGYGEAYYNPLYTASNSDSIKDFWLKLRPTSWGALHEIGHGHELRNLSDETLDVNEVWNNILVVFYQTIMFGNEIATKGSKLESMNIVKEIKNNVPVKDWGLFEKLSFLMHMFLKAGDKSFIKFNQLVRQEFSGSPFYASGTTLVEKLMHVFAIDFSIDVYPFMRLVKATIRKEQLYDHYYVISRVAYPLNSLISDTNELNAVKSKLGLLYETSLVFASELSSTKLKNDFTINIEPQLLDNLFGDNLKLVDGTRTVAEKIIQSQTIIFKDIPIGVYKVFVTPNPLNAKFIYDDFYAVIHASELKSLFLTAEELNEPLLSTGKLMFLGEGDRVFATLTSNPFKHLLSFQLLSTYPNYEFEDDKYFNIDVRNQENEVIFSKRLDGSSEEFGLHEIHFEGTVQIEIFHAETKTRFKTDDPMMDVIIDRDSNTNYLIANKQGFRNKNKKTPNELLQKNFIKKIDLIANKIKSKISLYSRPYCLAKHNLLLAVEAFEYLFKNNSVFVSLRNQYKDCLPLEYSNLLVEALVNLKRTSYVKFSKDMYTCKLMNNNTKKEAVLFNDETSTSISTIKFMGLFDLVAELFIDVRECAIHFNVLVSGEIHRGYINNTYIALTIRNKDGKVLLSKTLQGANVKDENSKVYFTELVEIDIFHAEPPNLTFNDATMGNIITKEKLNTLTLVKEFLNVGYNYKLRETDTGKKISLPNDESVIMYSKLNFLGINDKYAAAFYVNTLRSSLHFNVVSTDIHPSYGGKPYFGVKITEPNKKIKFEKRIDGSHPKTEEFEIPFEERVNFEVFHAEPTRLRPHNLAMRYLIDNKTQTKKFFLSKEIADEYYVYEFANVTSGKKVEFPIETMSSPISLLRFLGKNDKHVATLYLDLRNDRILFDVLSPKPHDEFGNEEYMSVTVQSELKELLFVKRITGLDDTKQNFAISFSDRIQIDVFHAEPSRLISDNSIIGNMIDRKKDYNNFTVKKSLNFNLKGKRKKLISKHSRKALKRRKSI